MNLSLKCILTDEEYKYSREHPEWLERLRRMLEVDAEKLAMDRPGKIWGVEVYNSYDVLLMEEKG